jgi:hypothetical protein
MPRLSLLPVVALLASCAVAVDVVGSPGRDGGTPPADAAPRRDAGGPIRDAGAREDGGPRVVAPPVLREVRPAGPANQNRVEVAAAAAALATVELFSDPDCTVPLAAAVAAADGTVVFGVDVEDDSTTTFYALARIGDGPPSACAGGLTYVEDSTPPEPPRILESDPASPADEPRPTFVGEAEARSAIRLYLDEGCLEEVAAGVALNDGAWAVPVEVPEDETSFLRATATDAAGNVSACSAPFEYVEATPVDPRVVFPPGPALTDEATITVRGTLASASNVIGVRVGGLSVTSSTTFERWRITIPLLEGDNVLPVEVDLATGEVVEGPTVEVVRSDLPSLQATDLAVDEGGDRAFFISTSDSRLRRVDLDTGDVTSLPDGGGPDVVQPFVLEWNDVDEEVYLGGLTGDRIVSVDPETGTRALVTGDGVGSGPDLQGARRIIHDGADAIYVATRIGFEQSIVEVDLTTGARGRLERVPSTGLFTWDPGADELLYYDFGARAVSAYDPATGTTRVVSSARVGSGPPLNFPSDMVVDGGTLLLSAGPNSLAIDLRSGNRTSFDFGSDVGVARPVDVDATDRRVVFVGSSNPQVFYVLARPGNALTSVVPAALGAGPHPIAPSALVLDEAGDRLWYADDTRDAVVEVSLVDGDRQDLNTTEALRDPVGIDYGEDDDELFVRLRGGFVAIVDASVPNAGPRLLDIGDPIPSGLGHVGVVYDEAQDRLLFPDRPAYLRSFPLPVGPVEDISSPARGSGPPLLGTVPQGVAFDGTTIVIDDPIQVYSVADPTGDRTSLGLTNSFGAAFQGLDVDVDEVWVASFTSVVGLNRSTGITRTIADRTTGAGPLLNRPLDVVFTDDGEVAYLVNRDPVGVFAVDRVTLERVIVSR